MEHDYKKSLMSSAILFALAVSPAAHAAEGDAVGSVLQLNTTTAGKQAAMWGEGDVAMDANGNFVAAWSDESGVDGDNSGIVLRRFYADGSAVDASDYVVNDLTSGFQYGVSVAAAPDGRFVLIYMDLSTKSLYGRLYDAEGNLQGSEFKVNAGGSSNSGQQVTMAYDGSFVVTWLSSTSIVTRRFSADGTALDASDVTIGGITSGYIGTPDIGMDPDGDYIVVWNEYDSDGSTTDSDVLARRFSADGTALGGGEFVVNTTVAGNQLFPGIAVDSDGNFVVAWREAGTNTGVYAKRFDADGNVLNDEFAVMLDGDYSGSHIDRPHVATDAEGDFAIAMVDYGSYSGDGFDVYLQRYDSSCTPLYTTPENVAGPVGNDMIGAVAMDADGDTVVMVANSDGDDGDGYGVFAQRYEGKGHTVDLSLVGSGDTATLGGNLTYTFTVTNNGSGTALGLSLEDVLPSGVSYTGFSSTDNWSCSDSSGTVTCTLTKLSSSVQSSVDIMVDTSAVTDSTIENTATITNGVTDANDTDNSDTVTTSMTASSGSGSSGGGGGAFGWLGLLFGLQLFRRRRFVS